jgi:hypothetical protein
MNKCLVVNHIRLSLTLAVSHLPVTTETRVQSWRSAGRIFGGQSGTGTSFSLNASIFPCQYHSTIAPYSFIHLPHTLYNVPLPVLQFSPVSIILPLLHYHLYLNTTVIRRTSGRCLGTFQKLCFSELVDHWV